jgi:hypothetical protein
MGMKETEGSLRAYFWFAGAVSAFIGFRDFAEVSKISDLLPTDSKAALYVQFVTRIVLGIAFVIAGFQLKSALRSGADWIKKMLIVSGIALTAVAVFAGLTFGSMFGNSWIVGAIVGIAITVYLYRSVVRLSAEAMAGKLDSTLA